jgi:hypothetical protein
MHYSLCNTTPLAFDHGNITSHHAVSNGHLNDLLDILHLVLWHVAYSLLVLDLQVLQPTHNTVVLMLSQ